MQNKFEFIFIAEVQPIYTSAFFHSQESVSKYIVSRPKGENQRSTCKAEVKSYKIKTNLTSNVLKDKVIDFDKICKISARSALPPL